MKPIQIFTEEYLERCRLMKPEQIVRILEDFRTKARLHGTPYQTQIKRLMNAWLDPSRLVP